MANSANDFLNSLDGLFKQVYADDIKNLVPDNYKLIKMIDFLPKDKTSGNLYHQPVIVAKEHGLTFAGSTDDAFALNAPVAGQLKDAQIQGNALVLRSVLGYNAASRSAGAGPKAFKDATKYLVKNMLESVTGAIEVELLYGQMGLAIVSSVSTNVITLTTASFASGIWSGAENMPLEIRDTAGTTLRGYANVSSVDLDARTVTVDAAPSGTTGTDVLWRKGAYGNEFAGLHKIMTNTGTLFNISASTYALWKGSEYGAGSADLSFAKIERAIAKAVAKGLNSDCSVLMNPKTWANVMVDQAALRKFDQSYSSSSMENGSKELKFHGQNGLIEIIPSIFCKEGFAYVFSKEDLVRVGSSDVTFERPGMEGKFFRDLEQAAGYEMRCYTDQALLCVAPGRTVVITGIVNS